jgi:glutamine amidotransferase
MLLIFGHLRLIIPIHVVHGGIFFSCACYSQDVSLSVLIVDYGAGNLRSVTRAVARSGASPVVTDKPDDLMSADAVILPGVGSAADTMDKLIARSLDQPLREYILSGRPFLGICMGLQALFDFSAEGGGQKCLGILPGTVHHFDLENFKVPHMGWNTVEWLQDHPVTEGIPKGAYFYFVHSFFAEPQDKRVILGQTSYGVTFPSVIAADNVFATQFHPEKSADLGLALYSNFVSWASGPGYFPGARKGGDN